MSVQHVSIPVLGVSCAGHSVERVLLRLPGVISAYVNGVTEVADIDYDDERLGIEALCERIEGCGFRAGPPQVRSPRST